MKLILHSTDVCLPDYWNGTSGLFLSVPVHHAETVADIIKNLHRELSVDGFYGKEDGKHDIGEEYRYLTTEEKDKIFADAKEILSGMWLSPLDKVNPFDLETPDLDENEFDDGIDSVYLYVMFSLEEE